MPPWFVLPSVALHSMATHCLQLTVGFGLSILDSVGLDKSIIHHCNITQSIFTAWKNPLALPIHLSTLPPLKTIDLLFSIVLPFPECHVTWNHTVYRLFIWLPSVNNMHVRFLPVFSWLDSSFLFSNWIIFCSLDELQLIYPFTCWRTCWLFPSFGI